MIDYRMKKRFTLLVAAVVCGVTSTASALEPKEDLDDYGVTIGLELGIGMGLISQGTQEGGKYIDFTRYTPGFAVEIGPLILHYRFLDWLSVGASIGGYSWIWPSVDFATVVDEKEAANSKVSIWPDGRYLDQYDVRVSHLDVAAGARFYPLVAASWGEGLFTSIDFGVSWLTRTQRRTYQEEDDIRKYGREFVKSHTTTPVFLRLGVGYEIPLWEWVYLSLSVTATNYFGLSRFATQVDFRGGGVVRF